MPPMHRGRRWHALPPALTLGVILASCSSPPDALQQPGEGAGSWSGSAFWDVQVGEPFLISGMLRVCATEPGVTLTAIEFERADNLTVSDWGVIPMDETWAEPVEVPDSVSDFGAAADNLEVTTLCGPDDSQSDIPWEAHTSVPGAGTGVGLLVRYVTADGEKSTLEVKHQLVLCQVEQECRAAEAGLSELREED